jgi:autotransporter-associated beta strand protein
MGLGTLTLTGTNSNTGTTLVADGTLVVDGSQPQSPVDVTNGTLGGDGTVGDVSISGNLAPGASPGSLDCSNLTFSATGDVFVELAGDSPGPYGYDQMNVRGTVALNGATLHVSNNSAPFEGQRFVIIANDGADPVTGTFAGLPNGSVLALNGVQFLLRYGSPGNDVALIVTNTPLRFRGPLQLMGGNLNNRPDPNECNAVGVVLSNATAATITGIRATLVPRSTGWAVTQPFAIFPDLAPGQSGANQTPFQISLLPGFVCGDLFIYDLIVEMDGYGPFRFALSSSTGLAGTPLRFDNNTPLAIPDAGTANSTLSVSGIDTAIQQVSVSLHINHPLVEDLDISLINPLGVAINLSSDNGGAAANYGAGCADNQRTVFKNGFFPPIAGASAPFVGTFQPDFSLDNLRGDFGSEVNGPWTLRVADDTAGNAGALQCWSLFLTPSVCLASGGACESCPERTLFGSISDQSLLQLGRLNRNGVASACGVAKVCPGREDFTQYRFDAYTFENGESNACITVTLGVNPNDGCDLFSVTYTNVFEPLSSCQNYLADLGNSLSSGQTNSYSFNVAARARFVVVVSQTEPFTTQCRYRLDVTGGSCRPVLHIANAGSNRAALDWTTAALGYQLERTNALAAPSAPAWVPITNAPRVLNSRHQVTNLVAPDNTHFYRLRKP